MENGHCYKVHCGTGIVSCQLERVPVGQGSCWPPNLYSVMMRAAVPPIAALNAHASDKAEAACLQAAAQPALVPVSAVCTAVTLYRYVQLMVPQPEWCCEWGGQVERLAHC